jgi:Na+-translocating ferredoxin:NAD+ oxidoreductase RNF subunit RnfB
MKLIHLDQEKCTQCTLCVKACPVQAITLGHNRGFPEISEQRCIGCGNCLSSCAYDALSYHNSVPAVKELLASGQQVAAILDPAIAAEFPDITDYRKFAGMIRLLDFAWIAETAFAVELIAEKYHKLLKEFKGKYYMSANCPSLVLFVEKFRPQLIKNLVPYLSPMTAMAMVMREAYGENIKIVGVVPCISAKMEASNSSGKSKVDEVITFTELRSLFKGTDISETALEFSDFDPPHGRLGSLYPISNGFVHIARLQSNLLNSKIRTAAGKQDFMTAIREFESHPEAIKTHFNLFYNKGCMMGPGMSFSSDYYRRHALVTDYTARRMSAVDESVWQENISKYSTLDFSRTFTVDDQRLPVPSEDQINEILSATGKKNINAQNACNLCGFDSCRSFAIAVSQGLTKTDQCLPYSVKTKQDYIKTLRNSYDTLSKKQQELIDSEKKAKEEALQAQQALQTLGVLIQKLPAGIVIVNENLRIVESNQSFINMLGEDAAMIAEVVPGLKNADLKTLLPFTFYNLFKFVLTNGDDVIGKDVHFEDGMLNVSIYSIIRNKIAGAVIRDMYLPEVQKEELVKRLSEVIDQNLQMVQEIGFLLGEGASNTERMLNSLIETHRAQQKKGGK